MACAHPREERLAVYAGGAVPLRDRTFCALCGEVIVIEAVAVEISATVRVVRKPA